MAEYVQQLVYTLPELAGHFNQILDLHRRRLWHQLTEKLEQFVQDPNVLEKGVDLVQFYTSFIKSFEQKLNQLALVRICIHIGSQIPEPYPRLDFLGNVSKLPKVADNPEALIHCKSVLGEWQVMIGNFAPAKELLDEAKRLLDSTASADSTVYSAYHHAWAAYYLSKQEPENFFTSALQFLGYAPHEQIPLEEREGLAFNMGAAALLGEKIFNFGELIQHPVLSSLKNTDREWMVEILNVFYSGNISAWVLLKQKYLNELNNPEYGLSAKAYVLEEKIAILSLLELVFNKPGEDRRVSFEIISNATHTPLDKVELLVMRALSLGLIKGTIDEVDQVVYITWVQPRVLNVSQIGQMATRLKLWSEGVKNSLLLLENQVTPELIS